MYKSIAVSVLAPALLLGACLGPYEPKDEIPEETGGFALVSELFEEISESGGGKTTRFHTNDNRYWSEYGYTLWTVWGDDTLIPFAERTVTMSKPKGFASACYGMVICQGTRPAEGKNTLTMLTVMINNAGQYALGKVIGGRYEEILELTLSPYLQAGTGAPNTLRVEYNGGIFSLFINGEFTHSFTDAIEPVHSGGRNGYIVVIAPIDKFPEGEVDVYFTETK
jgi:hypothetical protein